VSTKPFFKAFSLLFCKKKKKAFFLEKTPGRAPLLTDYFTKTGLSFKCIYFFCKALSTGKFSHDTIQNGKAVVNNNTGIMFFPALCLRPSWVMA
jgi:hypothetical protein